MSIPLAPPVPARKSGCKVIIKSGKIDEGYCITSTDLEKEPYQTDEPNFGKIYKLPGTDIIIDKMSAVLFKKTDTKAFVAIAKTIGNSHVRVNKKKLYVLFPLDRGVYEKYEKKEIEPKDIEKKYEDPSIKGEGGYGKVEFYPTYRIARKIAKIHEVDIDFGLKDDMVREIAIYKLLSEISCLPKMIDFDVKNETIIDMELGVETLYDFIKTKKIDVQTNILIMFRLAKCLRTIASQGIIHADLKPINIILSKDGNVQIIDWGLAVIDQSKDQQKEKWATKQALWYKAPEIAMVRTGVYSNKIDIFSLGLIFFELFTKTPLVSENTPVQQSEKLLEVLLNKKVSIREEKFKTDFNNPNSEFEIIKAQLILNNLPENIADLVAHMLEFNPSNRWSYDQIILHPLFQHIYRENIPKLPIFINNMPFIEDISKSWNTDKLLRKPREIIFEFISNMSITLKANLDILCLTYQLLDLAVYKNKEIDIEDYSFACFLLACKIYEVDMRIRDLVRIGGTDEKIRRHEKEIIKLLKGNLIIPSAYTYYSRKNGPVPLTESTANACYRFYKNKNVYRQPFTLDIVIPKIDE